MRIGEVAGRQGFALGSILGAFRPWDGVYMGVEKGGKRWDSRRLKWEKGK